MSQGRAIDTATREPTGDLGACGEAMHDGRAKLFTPQPGLGLKGKQKRCSPDILLTSNEQNTSHQAWVLKGPPPPSSSEGHKCPPLLFVCLPQGPLGSVSDTKEQPPGLDFIMELLSGFWLSWEPRA